jgi:hypothetical protein
VSTPADDQKILWEAVIEIAHLRAEYTSAYVDRKQKTWRKSSWTSADADRFEREAVQRWNANHPALIALWKFQKAHAESLKAAAPSSEDTPADTRQWAVRHPSVSLVAHGSPHSVLYTASKIPGGVIVTRASDQDEWTVETDCLCGSTKPTGRHYEACPAGVPAGGKA